MHAKQVTFTWSAVTERDEERLTTQGRLRVVVCFGIIEFENVVLLSMCHGEKYNVCKKAKYKKTIFGIIVLLKKYKLQEEHAAGGKVAHPFSWTEQNQPEVYGDFKLGS